jgi:hypothetical protein
MRQLFYRFYIVLVKYNLSFAIRNLTIFSYGDWGLV